VNCLRNPGQILPIAEEMRRAVPGFVACQATAYRTPPDISDFTAMNEFPFETEVLSLSRKEMGRYASQAHDLGIQYIGSCCGSIPVHVREMARALGKKPPDPTWRIDYREPMSAFEYYGHGKGGV
jgi:betaine-homocysteine S-methyltransferase